MQLCLNFGLTSTWEMDDAELLKDLSEAWASRRRSMEKIRCLSTQQWIREKRLSLNQVDRNTEKRFFHRREQVLARRPGSRVNEHHRAIREMDNQVNQYIEMPQIQYIDKVAEKSVVVQRQVSLRTTETKHRIFKLTVNIFKQRFF